jgi:hypothetical protein
MTSPITRRDLIFGLGGGLAGLALTPVPWKLLDDVAIWTQHRRALPIPAAGEVAFRPSACTLCPGGCALRVRCIAGRPVSAVGESSHPLGGGACALGLTIHHLALHPLRLRTPMRWAAEMGRREPITLDQAVAAMAEAMTKAGGSGEAVAVLDQRPGRAISQAYRELLGALPQGLYLTIPGEGETQELLGTLVGSSGPLGVDLDHTQTLLSFGTPVLDGWGRPGRILGRRAEIHLIQVDSWRTPTAALADQWVPIRPGTEGTLALGLAHVILREGLNRADGAPRLAEIEHGGDYERLVADATPGRVAKICGIEATSIVALARRLAAGRPTLVLADGDPARGPLPRRDLHLIAALNLLLGAVGRPGGMVARAEVPQAGVAGALAPVTPVSAVAEGKVRVLVLDSADSGSAVPWPLLERTLAQDALVVSLSPFAAGLGRHAHLVVPAPAPLESFDEVLPAASSAVASYGIAAPLLPKPEEATDPVELVRRVAVALELAVGFALSNDDLLKRRVAAVHGRRGGRFLAREAAGYSEAAAASPEGLWQGLIAGGCWIDSTVAPLPGRRVTLLPPGGDAPAGQEAAEGGAMGLTLVPVAARGTVGSTPASPLLTKLYRESKLRRRVGVASIHPATGERLRLRDGDRVRLTGAGGSVEAQVLLDPDAPIDGVVMATGPDFDQAGPAPGSATRATLALCVPESDGSWRKTRVRVQGA